MKKLRSLLLCSAALSLPLSTHAGAFSDLVSDGENFSNWIGTFTFLSDFTDGQGFINHAEHGALFVVATDEDVWLYDWNIAAIDGLSGWIFTNRFVYPYFFVQDLPAEWVIYVDGVPGPRETSRIFVELGTGNVVLLPKFTTRNLAEVAIAAGDFNTLVTALTITELAGVVAEGGPFTVFAPTDAAFGLLDEALLTALTTTETDTLANILLYHVVDGVVTSEDLLFDPMSIFRGQQLDFYLPTLAGTELFVQTTPMGVLINGTPVLAPDIRAANGVIHVIGEVLLPPGTVVDLAISNGFSTLVDLVVAADLAGVLSGEGPFTVFAPTNEAFAALDPETVAFLLSEEGIPTLANILTYHVVPGKIFASEVPVDVDVFTVNGAPVVFSSGDSGLQINGVNIIATNVLGSNGIIHVIDGVILPPAE
ncbi:MAG: fasciclin domain-containing protein [Verrucomicrobia bacterium]|nr:fasciclin domain-containing protein [Verrucomicrobiota bacterium]